MRRHSERRTEVGVFLQSLPVFWILFGISLLAVLHELGLRQVEDKEGYHLNVYTELLSVAVTVLIVNTWYRFRDLRRREQDLKDRLLRDACSPEPAIARHAFYELRKHEFIYGELSILRGADLSQAKPGKVILDHAVMDEANFWSSNFSGSSFSHTILDRANLEGASLEQTILFATSMRNANLAKARFDGAELLGVDFTGARLSGADLSKAHILIPENNSKELDDPFVSILPNGEPVCMDTDIEKFTDRFHPDFWEPV